MGFLFKKIKYVRFNKEMMRSPWGEGGNPMWRLEKFYRIICNSNFIIKLFHSVKPWTTENLNDNHVSFNRERIAK